MKISLLIIVTVLGLILPVNLIYAPPSVNPDWPEYPYCPGGCSREILVDEWAQYYDMKGQEWMEKKRADLFDAYNNGTLDVWIDSDPSKANQNTYTYYYILGEIPNSDGEYYVGIPLCVDGIYVSDDAICSTGDSPPCPEPSFRKNGMCVVEKKSLCGDNTVLKNYKCIPDKIKDNEIICGKGTELVDGVCHVVKTDKYPSGDCLIATASYGSELAPQVQMLREIRDNTLLNTESGQIFMSGFNSIYYLFSPTIAQWENENPVFKDAVKLFITPMITALSIMTLAEDSEVDVILYGMSTIGLIVGMYVVIPVTLIWKVRK